MSAAFAPRQIHNESASFETGNAAREPRKLIALRANGSHCFSQSRRFTIDHAPCSFRRVIARTQTGSSNGHYQRRATPAHIAKPLRNSVFLIGEQIGVDLRIRPLTIEQSSSS